MTLIAVAFTLTCLILAWYAFHPPSTGDPAPDQNPQQQFHTFVEKIDADINRGAFDSARNTCATAISTLSTASLDRKTVTDQLLVDLKRLAKNIEDLQYQQEAIPLYQILKDRLKKNLDDRHVITREVKSRLKHWRKQTPNIKRR